MNEAIANHQRGELAKARECYLQLLEHAPRHPDALHLAGITYFQEGNFTDAEAYIRSAIAVRPDYCDYWSNLGLVLKAANRFDDAIDSLQSALSIDPDNPDTLNNLGSTLVATGRPEQAVETFRRLLAKDPGHAEACNNLAVVLASETFDPEAETLYLTALNRQPRYLDARMNFGRMLHRAGRYEEATEQFRAAIDIDPGCALAYRELADALLCTDRIEEAEATCRSSLKIDPHDDDTIVTLGGVLQKSGRTEDAERCYRDALELNPDNARAYNNLGTLALADKDLDGAMHFFTVAGKKDPGFVEAMFNKGMALQKLGRYAEAAGQFSMVIARNPRIPNAFRYLSEIYRISEMRDSQIKVLRHWLEHDPTSATANHLLRAAEGSEKPHRASDEFVTEEFDGFADSFDETLESLQYESPRLLGELLGEAVSGDASLDVLDAGCGTGLCGPWLTPFAGRLVGVDLSGKMLEKAELRGGYDELHKAELTAFLADRRETYDLVVSADTLVYFGDLEPVFGAAATAVRPDGLFLFSAEALDSEDAGEYRLNPSGRYAHSERYLVEALRKAGFGVMRFERAAIRTEAQNPVTGYLVLARRRQLRA